MFNVKNLKKLVIVLATTVAVALATVVRPQSCRKDCPPNQVFTTRGTRCPQRCCKPPPKFCPNIPITGCQCKPGFILNDCNECVSPGECNCDCPPNQVFTTAGTACPLRCGQPPPEICTLQAVVGCQCKHGYLLNCRDECVLPEDCDES